MRATHDREARETGRGQQSECVLAQGAAGNGGRGEGEQQRQKCMPIKREMRRYRPCGLRGDNIPQALETCCPPSWDVRECSDRDVGEERGSGINASVTQPGRPARARM